MGCSFEKVKKKDVALVTKKISLSRGNTVECTSADRRPNRHTFKRIDSNDGDSEEDV